MYENRQAPCGRGIQVSSFTPYRRFTSYEQARQKADCTAHADNRTFSRNRISSSVRAVTGAGMASWRVPRVTTPQFPSRCFGRARGQSRTRNCSSETGDRLAGSSPSRARSFEPRDWSGKEARPPPLTTGRARTPVLHRTPCYDFAVSGNLKPTYVPALSPMSASRVVSNSGIVRSRFTFLTKTIPNTSVQITI